MIGRLEDKLDSWMLSIRNRRGTLARVVGIVLGIFAAGVLVGNLLS